MDIGVERGLDALRAAEKQTARAVDLEDVRRGLRSPEQVNADNSLACKIDMSRFKMSKRLGVGSAA